MKIIGSYFEPFEVFIAALLIGKHLGKWRCFALLCLAASLSLKILGKAITARSIVLCYHNHPSSWGCGNVHMATALINICPQCLESSKTCYHVAVTSINNWLWRTRDPKPFRNMLILEREGANPLKPTLTNVTIHGACYYIFVQSFDQAGHMRTHPDVLLTTYTWLFQPIPTQNTT
jgi:hypothetical protein